MSTEPAYLITDKPEADSLFEVQRKKYPKSGYSNYRRRNDVFFSARTAGVSASTTRTASLGDRAGQRSPGVPRTWSWINSNFA
jgi:hypothetical protein